ncbi:MAG: flagellar biosynthetic protein FliR [Silvanigrellales bacterium]|nr:flagellar biosynthetic protein FliR [Silvanigrellales bacterium]
MGAEVVSIETLLNLDPKVWPIAAMAFLRVLTVFLFLPVFGDNAVPTRLRLVFAIMFTFFLWPVFSDARFATGIDIWSPFSLALATVREVFFGFATGFAGKLLIHASSISSNLVGVNMGFQAASLFSPATGEQESSFATFKGWLVLMCLLAMNVHHIFLTALVDSFHSVPLGGPAQDGAVAQAALQVVHASFLLGLRLAAPLLVVQLLVTLALGLLNRALPQLNALVMQFPLSFAVSMVVLFFSATAFVRVVGGAGLGLGIGGYQGMQHAFREPPKSKEPVAFPPPLPPLPLPAQGGNSP